MSFICFASPAGTECSGQAKEDVMKHFVDGLKGNTRPCTPRNQSFSSYGYDSRHDLSESMHSSFKLASLNLEEIDTIDATESGTTAVCLFLTEDNLHTANVGDSRCILISTTMAKWLSMH